MKALLQRPGGDICSSRHVAFYVKFTLLLRFFPLWWFVPTAFLQSHLSDDLVVRPSLVSVALPLLGIVVFNA